MDPRAGIAARARALFAAVFGTDRVPRVSVAPGRVNLIGEHTDYNEGVVLPMATQLGVAAAFVRRDDGILRAHSAAFDETREIAIASLSAAREPHWLAYVAGVAWALERAGFPICGLDIAIVSDLPVGAGLASSAALEIATARALSAATESEWDPTAMARVARHAEREFVGVDCGIMDQLTAAAGIEGCALLLDCRSLDARAIPLPEPASVVVMDTGVGRSLTESAYNERRAACARALEVLRRLDPGIGALRDVDEPLLRRAQDLIDPVTYRRARHVVSEIGRPHQMAEALTAGDLVGAGRLMNDSHASLRDLYEVSSRELEVMVSEARIQDACFGARLTGAGFGGSAVALVATPDVQHFIQHVRTGYTRRTGREGACFTCRPAAGARLDGE